MHSGCEVKHKDAKHTENDSGRKDRATTGSGAAEQAICDSSLPELMGCTCAHPAAKLDHELDSER